LPVEHVTIERAFFRGPASWVLTAYQVVIAIECFERGIPFVRVPPATLKKWATGNGRSGKPEMIAAAQRRGYTGCRPDEADAFLCLKYGQQALMKSGRAVV
jgi:Holliday junction resolvasome RuvABC endonuclease subunit